MEIAIRGEPKEIAALVLAVQERQCGMISIVGTKTAETNRINLVDTIRSVLLETASAGSQSQQPDSIERTQNQDENPITN